MANELHTLSIGGKNYPLRPFKMTTEGDNRAVATTPNDYKNEFIFRGLKSNNSFGKPSGATYSYVFGLRGWSDNSGGEAHELAFNNNGVFRRQGATDAWGAWVKFLDSSNYTDYTIPKDGTGATGTWPINISGNAATATKLHYSLTVGEKNYNGEGTVNITAADLGLSSALIYIGQSSTLIADGGTQTPTVDGKEITPLKNGYVVFYGNDEFVWNGSAWEFLGDDRNFKIIQSPVPEPDVIGTDISFISKISQDANGVITVEKKTGNFLQLTGGTVSGTVTINKASSGDNMFWTTTTDSDFKKQIGFGVGNSKNRGLYDKDKGWVVCIDTGNNVTFNGTATNATHATNATYADSAGSATTAGTCTGNSATATTASYAEKLGTSSGYRTYGDLPWSGAPTSIESLTSFSSANKSYLGSVCLTDNVWHNIISSRHRNGASDGNKYGFYLTSPLTSAGDLKWNKETNGTWQGERTILDSSYLVDTTKNASASAKGSGSMYSVELDTNGDMCVAVPWSDTKNTAGSTNSTSKLYLVGATTQAANPQTYSNSKCYSSGNYLYSNSEKVDVRLTTSLVPVGTSITASSSSVNDLNKTDYLKVGKYYCSANASVLWIQNCPTKNAFMMEVYSPLSTTIDNETTAKYVYRIRKLTEYNTGKQYIQFCSVGATVNTWTYGAWRVAPLVACTLTAAAGKDANGNVNSTTNNGSSSTCGSTTKGVYIKSDGTIAACSYKLEQDVTTSSKLTDTTYSAGSGLSLSGTTFNHSNSVTAVTTAGLYKVKYDAQGHITGTTAIAKADITGLGIPAQDTTYSAGTGLSLSGTTINHSNSVTAKTTAGLYKIKHDAQGHITSSEAATASDLPTHTHTGLDGLSDIVEITKSLKVTTAWMDTGISGNNLVTGTHIVQIVADFAGEGGLWSEYFSGIMSWYSGSCNSSDSDEIFLHKAGHATNGKSLFLRTIRQANSNVLKLQICSSADFSTAKSVKFKFKKMI